MGETYAKLVVQPIDLVRAFKVDFCLASVIKWLTKWHMERKSEYLQRVQYYVPLCDDVDVDKGLLFAIRMYCMVNKFMEDNTKSCLLVDVVWLIMNKRIDDARRRLEQQVN